MPIDDDNEIIYATDGTLSNLPIQLLDKYLHLEPDIPPDHLNDESCEEGMPEVDAITKHLHQRQVAKARSGDEGQLPQAVSSSRTP
ncbi:hypothetical protein [Pseudomonas sp. NCCP-436]|uniref:hypothetical protein n=1 Tax=Pseudomonas sp. NCCP-436 TaxID=2842481 RepID=UPI001C80043D|nr:hypothetical protein [Pseudomonas sp. NCCP-436]GIZ11186.1 hypothetical protein NCCP436_06020 [Pseudomonas sp. NCCP-436]